VDPARKNGIKRTIQHAEIIGNNFQEDPDMSLTQ
jgi:hypothetical protein